MALARAQLESHTPDCQGAYERLPAPPESNEPLGSEQSDSSSQWDIEVANHEEELPVGEDLPLLDESDAIASDTTDASDPIVTNGPTATDGSMGPNWPGESCPVPTAPLAGRPECLPHYGPVLKHTRIYHGTDPDITQALQGYVYFRDDARFGGWESYLQRSDDFVRFCCHMHISEMLSARGGSRKTRVVWRWPESR